MKLELHYRDSLENLTKEELIEIIIDIETNYLNEKLKGGNKDKNG